jgi:hypothetical protein
MEQASLAPAMARKRANPPALKSLPPTLCFGGQADNTEAAHDDHRSIHL